MDKQLRNAINAARTKKDADARASRKASEAEAQRKAEELEREIKAAMPKARKYVRDVLIPKIAEEAANGKTELTLGSMMESLPIKPYEALVRALNAVDGLNAHSGHHDGEYHEGYGYDSYDYVKITWKPV